jgi:hypothetical protein
MGSRSGCVNCKTKDFRLLVRNIEPGLKGVRPLDMQKQVPTATLGLRLSPEETARFGVRCARVDDVAIEQFDELLALSRREEVQLLIFRCDARSIATAQRAEREGFQLMDTLAHAVLDVAQQVAIPSPLAVRISIADPAERGAVASLSRAAFAGHVGHYHAAVGEPWLLGSYPGSQAFATRALARLPCEDLAKAWILLAPEGRRALSEEVQARPAFRRRAILTQPGCSAEASRTIMWFCPPGERAHWPRAAA